MLELMLAGNNKTIIPESGPGNKQLIAGNRTDGWFGLVSPEEMPSTATIATLSGLAITLPQTRVVPLNWLKAVLDGKFIFYPSTPFNNLTLTAIYNAGAVYGTDDNGLNVPTGSSPTNQLKVLTFTDKSGKTWCFKLRLINSANPNDLTAVTTPSQAKVEAGEMFKLYSHVMLGTPSPVDGVKWDKLGANVDVYVNRYHSTSIYSNQVFNGAPNSVVAQYAFTAVTTIYPWMPLLELMNPDVELIPPFDVTGTPPVLTPMNPVLGSTINTLAPPLTTMVSGTELQPWVSAGSLPEPLTPSAINVVNSSELPAKMTN